MKARLVERKWLIPAAALAVSALVSCARGAATVPVRSRIGRETQDGVYLDAGTDQGLRVGRTGVLQLDDGRTFTFQVLFAGEQSSLLRLAGYGGPEGLVGRVVEIILSQESLPPGKRRPGTPEDPNAESAPAATSRNPDGAKEFVPLLAPAPRVSDTSRPASVSHGRVQVGQTFQADAQGDLGYSVTRVGSSGSVDRIGGSAWSFEWSGDLRYRTGDAFLSHPDYQEPQLDVYRATFQRQFGKGEFLRFGRFVPYELPAIGYVDGLQGQVHPSEHVSVGLAGGLKPNRVNLEPSTDEPFVVPYTTFTAGPRNGRHYSGTVGLLNSYYRGSIDRLALLFDQRAGWGKRLTLYSTAVLDFDVGTSEARTGTRLTQLDVSALSELSSFLTLRAGVDHWERPDHQAQNALLPFPDERFFDNGYWRYWVGGSQNLPWSLRLYEEVGYVDSDTVPGDVRWQVSLTRIGLGPWPGAAATVTVYNLIAEGSDGYGCRVSGHLPLNKGTIVVQPSVGFRVLQGDSQAQDIALSYLSVGLDGYLSRHWSLFGDATYFTGDNADATLLELGLRFAW